MPRWVPLFLLGMGVLFLGVGVVLGTVVARNAQAEVVRLEALPSLAARAVERQATGAQIFVEGALSDRNPTVFRDFVAYEREELDVTTDSDGDTRRDWRSSGRDTPPLLVDAAGDVRVGNDTYSIARGHATWYDETTLGFTGNERDGTIRYHGLLAGEPVTVLGAVVAGPEGRELAAELLYAGTREAFLESRRESAAALPFVGLIFGVVGAILGAVGGWLFVRR